MAKSFIRNISQTETSLHLHIANHKHEVLRRFMGVNIAFNALKFRAFG